MIHSFCIKQAVVWGFKRKGILLRGLIFDAYLHVYGMHFCEISELLTGDLFSFTIYKVRFIRALLPNFVRTLFKHRNTTDSLVDDNQCLIDDTAVV